MRRQLGTFGMMAAMLAMMGTSASSATQASNNGISKEFKLNRRAQIKAIKDSKKIAGGIPYKHYQTPKGNQRQYRKFLRQNPHMRRSKKSRL